MQFWSLFVVGVPLVTVLAIRWNAVFVAMWDRCASFGCLGNTLACCGLLWPVVACCGLLWPVVPCCGLIRDGDMRWYHLI